MRAVPSVMRAVTMAKGFGGPEVLSVQNDIPVPKPNFEQNEILIKVAASAVNRADTMQRKGLYPPPPGASNILGLECSGTVVQVAEKEKTKWKVGDNVMALLSGGGQGEFCVAHEDSCLPIPKNCPNIQTAAGIPEVFLTAYQCCRIGGLSCKTTKKPNVLIHAGASGVGTALCQIVTALGGVPIITASADKLQDPIVRKVCPEYRFERNNAPTAPPQEAAAAAEGGNTQRPVTPPTVLPTWVEQIQSSPLGKDCIDFVIDPVVGSGYLQGDIELIKSDGKIIILAMMGGNKIKNFETTKLFKKRGTITASTLRAREAAYKGELVSDFMANVFPYLFSEESSCRIEPIISKELKIEQIAEAHKIIDNNEIIGKCVLTF